MTSSPVPLKDAIEVKVATLSVGLNLSEEFSVDIHFTRTGITTPTHPHAPATTPGTAGDPASPAQPLSRARRNGHAEPVILVFRGVYIAA